MLDRDFFLSDVHPARRLVDTLASASVGWAPEWRDVMAHALQTGGASATATDGMIKTHALAIRMNKTPAPDSQTAALESRQGEAAIQQLEERRAARQALEIDDRFDAVAYDLKCGMWFDVDITVGTRVRCRLSWVSPLRSRLLFTNRDGFDAFVRSEREVAAMVRLGRMAVVDQVPIVGRALEHLLQDPEVGLAQLQAA